MALARAIYNLGTPDQSLYIVSVGQSGNVSPHYDDLLGLWADAQPSRSRPRRTWSVPAPPPSG
jgi:acyl-homoserine lactone acylase PvdQ